MEDKVIKILHEYNFTDIPENLRQVCEDYFCDPSNSDTSDVEALAQPLLDDSENILVLNIEDIPRVSEDQDLADHIVEEVEVIEGPLVNTPNQPLIPDEEDGLHEEIWESLEVAEEDYSGGVSREADIRKLKAEICCSKKCIDLFTVDELLRYSQECHALDYYVDGSNILDVTLLAGLRAMALTHDEIKTGKGCKQKERERARMRYCLRGTPVCEKIFLVSHAIKIKRFKRLIQLFKESSLHIPSHGNVKRTPKKTCSQQQVAKVVSFIQHHAEQAALFMPGRLANQKQIVKLLPSSDTKIGLFKKYKLACVNSNEESIGRSTFYSLWKTFCSDVVIMKPCSDLCAECQNNYTSHSKLRGVSLEEKLNFFKKCSDHLRRVEKERKHYHDLVSKTKKSFSPENIFLNLETGCAIPNSYDGEIHYSFDYAQQVHIPHDPLQPGPIYFLTPYKIGIFGVMCDTAQTQHNYLIPEAVSICKGSNSVVSYIHHYFTNFSHGEKHLKLHADNCVAQNKNNYIMAYLNWRILNNLNTTISLSFLPVGHTKFGCDWAFGLFKQRFRLEKASCINDVADIIRKSTIKSNLNRAVVTGNEKGDVLVEIYDWQKYFAVKEWNAIPNITNFNHFEFSNERKGKVLCKVDSDGVGKELFIMSEKTEPLTDLPDALIPPGLSDARQLYLYKKIREYCTEETRDIVCPIPQNMPECQSKPASVVKKTEVAGPSQKRKRKTTLAVSEHELHKKSTGSKKIVKISASKLKKKINLNQ